MRDWQWEDGHSRFCKGLGQLSLYSSFADLFIVASGVPHLFNVLCTQNVEKKKKKMPFST